MLPRYVAPESWVVVNSFPGSPKTSSESTEDGCHWKNYTKVFLDKMLNKIKLPDLDNKDMVYARCFSKDTMSLKPAFAKMIGAIIRERGDESRYPANVMGLSSILVGFPMLMVGGPPPKFFMNQGETKEPTSATLTLVCPTKPPKKKKDEPAKAKEPDDEGVSSDWYASELYNEGFVKVMRNLDETIRGQLPELDRVLMNLKADSPVNWDIVKKPINLPIFPIVARSFFRSSVDGKSRIFEEQPKCLEDARGFEWKLKIKPETIIIEVRDGAYHIIQMNDMGADLSKVNDALSAKFPVGAPVTAYAEPTGIVGYTTSNAGKHSWVTSVTMDATILVVEPVKPPNLAAKKLTAASVNAAVVGSMNIDIQNIFGDLVRLYYKPLREIIRKDSKITEESRQLMLLMLETSKTPGLLEKSLQSYEWIEKTEESLRELMQNMQKELSDLTPVELPLNPLSAFDVTEMVQDSVNGNGEFVPATVVTANGTAIPKKRVREEKIVQLTDKLKRGTETDPPILPKRRARRLHAHDVASDDE